MFEKMILTISVLVLILFLMWMVDDKDFGSSWAMPSMIGFAFLLLCFLVKIVMVTDGNCCPNCDNAVSINSEYCTTCGYDMEPSCSKCGAEILDNYIFCPTCGEKVVTLE